MDIKFNVSISSEELSGNQDLFHGFLKLLGFAELDAPNAKTDVQLKTVSDNITPAATVNVEDTPVTHDLPQQAYTIEYLRELLMSLTRAKGKDTIKKLLSDFGVSRLSDLAEDDYPQFVDAMIEVA